jgi:hypothetical protein
MLRDQAKTSFMLDAHLGAESAYAKAANKGSSIPQKKKRESMPPAQMVDAGHAGAENRRSLRASIEDAARRSAQAGKPRLYRARVQERAEVKLARRAGDWAPARSPDCNTTW